MRFASWLIPLFLLAVTSLAAGGYVVAVSFEFPERPPVQVAISYSEVVELTGVKHPYKVEFWVRGALAKANLKYQADLVDGRRTITAIDNVRNDATGTWVYFVDGVRSKYHINTQTAPQPRSIRFVFERPRDR
jgi:hypothetical protein